MHCLSLTLVPLFIPALILAQSITISGSIHAERTGAPLPEAKVLLYSASWSLLDTLSTDAFGSWSATFPVSSAGSPHGIPATFALGQNYPNPFNPSTRIPFALQNTAEVSITVHTILGQQLDHRTLHLDPGAYSIEWKTRGSAGVLFYTVEIDGERHTRKMVQLDGGASGGLGNVMIGSFMLETRSAIAASVDSIHAVLSRHLYEPDTLTLPFIDGTHADHALGLIHDRAFVIDLHNDVLEQIVGDAPAYSYQIGVRNVTNDTDIPRMRDGGLDAQVFAVWVTTTAANYYTNSVKYLDSLKAQFHRNASDIALATGFGSLDSLSANGKIAGIMCCEGGEAIDSSLDKLRSLYARGVRMMTITWNNRAGVPWARAHNSPEATTVGLNGIGGDVIRLMDSLGMIIDVSHVGPKTIDDILATTANPIIASHSCARALANNSRNLTDAQLIAIANKGGVIGVNFYPPFVTVTSSATIDSVIQHIDYMKNLVGIDHIGLGADYDGYSVNAPPPYPPTGLRDVSAYPNLTEALLNRGYTREEVRKILGENFLRVFRAVCH